MHRRKWEKREKGQCLHFTQRRLDRSCYLERPLWYKGQLIDKRQRRHFTTASNFEKLLITNNFYILIYLRCVKMTK